MFRCFGLSIAVALAMSAAPAFADEGKVSRERLERIMADWPADVRTDAERLIEIYGLPDRVTSTVLVWDVPDVAQQQAMVRDAGDMRASAEAGAHALPLTP